MIFDYNNICSCLNALVDELVEGLVCECVCVCVCERERECVWGGGVISGNRQRNKTDQTNDKNKKNCQCLSFDQ